MLVRAAERAASLAANAEAQRAFERALELTDDPLVQAELHERAGTMARMGSRADEAAAHFERSIALFEAEGATHPAARVSARLAEILWDRGRLEYGLESMDRAFEVLSQEEPDEDLAALAAQLGRFMFFAGRPGLAMQRIETALDIAEALSLPEVLSQALNTKAIILITPGPRKEGLALLRYALDVALEHDKPSAALRAYYNLADTLCHVDRYEEAANAVREGLARPRVGKPLLGVVLLGQLYPFFALGNWDEALAMIAEVHEEDWAEARQAVGGIAAAGVVLYSEQGRKESSTPSSTLRHLPTSRSRLLHLRQGQVASGARGRRRRPARGGGGTRNGQRAGPHAGVHEGGIRYRRCCRASP